MKTSLAERTIRVSATVVVLAGLAAIAIPVCRKLEAEYCLAEAKAMLTRAPGIDGARVVAPEMYRLSSLLAFSQRTRGFAIAAAIEAAAHDRSPDTQHTAGVACLLADELSDATRHLENAARGAENTVFWTDLSAAYYVRALRDKSDEQLLASLAASTRALAIDPRRPEAAYNFALATERLGAAPAAAVLWKRYLELDDDPAWQHEARLRLASLLRGRPATRSWQELISTSKTDLTELARASTSYRQQARAWAEVEGLGRWAEARRSHDLHAAETFLEKVRVIGKALQQSSGESQVIDAVTAIDRAEDDRDQVRMNALINGYLLYQRGRQRYHDNRPKDALDDFDAASRLLRVGGSPTAKLASAYAASTLHDTDHFSEAADRLSNLEAEERKGDATHFALRAQTAYQMARLDAIRGLWSDAIMASSAAMTLYERIDEGGNEGMAALLHAEAYDFVGQPAIAIQHGTTAINLLAAAGDTYRLRVAVAVLCRSYMRRKEWDGALAMIRLERSMERLSPDPVLTSDTLLRAAIVEEKLGRSKSAGRLLRDAATQASRIPDKALRTSVLADVSGASGVLVRGREPVKSMALLSESIEYLVRTDRAIQLPQLYLERGRAQRMIGHATEALADFERGIAALEMQRNHLSDSAMRYGIFDDVHELFTEAAAAYLDAGDWDHAFRTIERSRARSLVEQIARVPNAPPSTPTLTFVCQQLPRGTLLIEYAFLHDGLRIFLASRDLMDVRRVAVDSSAVSAKGRAFVDALVERRPVAEVEALASELYVLLLAPVPEHLRYERLVIVPDPALQQMPFAALFDQQKRVFLIEQDLLVMDPSASVFLESRKHSVRRSAAPRKAAVFIGGREAGSLRLRPLPELEREAGVIGAVYPSSTLITSGEASIARFLAESSRAQVVHFGGHALVDPFDPTRSALVLAPEVKGEAGLLTCERIAAANLRTPRVVVLAACSTMRGRDGRADGTPNIARSFLAAGVPTVVGTLWDIDDTETAVLIANVHQLIARGLPPAAALRTAQLNALKNPYPPASHPGSWAAFAVLGSGGF